MRVATWNLKQAVAPKKPLPELWEWAEKAIDPDVIVLTEAKVPKDGVPEGWTAVWTPGGIGPRRRWGNVIAGRGVELEPVTKVDSGPRTKSIEPEWPATLGIVDVLVGGERWATLAAMYGLTVNHQGESCGHGRYSVPKLLATLDPLLRSERGERLIVAGDMNLWPRDVSYLFERVGLIDLIEWTRNERPPLERCANCAHTRDPECGHLWTHKNGNSPNAAVQQIDFIFATEQLAQSLDRIFGGVSDFPDAWDVSDHAPVVADFR
jgi:exonuclease III